eukprot:TRINITY_DN330_c0_g1_i1.p1 TRINITY_DN330_c0_g1~~TRINITY_DN330_c0_g1_i1.p1  ORF type:complete len:678 (-),score=156.03 TRINITY_DN330_c0_g1_i1:212-2245(-)
MQLSYPFSLGFLFFALATLLVPASATIPDIGSQPRLRGSRVTASGVTKVTNNRSSNAAGIGEDGSLGVAVTANGLVLSAYSDDDESCTEEGITPGVCALADLARSPITTKFKAKVADNVASSSSVTKNASDPDTVLSERLQRALMTEITSALAGKHSGFSETRLKEVQEELRHTFSSLPEAAEDNALFSSRGLGLSAARFLLHQHFLRRRHWYVRGLNPAGDSHPDQQTVAEALRSRVAGRLLKVLTEQVGKRGLNLHELSVFVATFEHLIEGDSQQRLKNAWALLNLTADEKISAVDATQTLVLFMAHYVYGTNLPLTSLNLTRDVVMHEVRQLDKLFKPWNETKASVAKAVAKTAGTREGKVVSFADSLHSIEQVLGDFSQTSARTCIEMRDRLMSVKGASLGRVSVAEVRKEMFVSTFHESNEYLREIGALDETNPADPLLILPNYLYGPSNCDGATSFYDLCCPNLCEAHMEQLEMRLERFGKRDAVTIADVLEDLLRRRDSGADGKDLVDAEKIKADLRMQLMEIQKATNGTIRIHGRQFAELMYSLFPLDCTRPRKEEYRGPEGDAVPDALSELQGTALMKGFDVPKDQVNWDWVHNGTKGSMSHKHHKHRKHYKPFKPPKKHGKRAGRHSKEDGDDEDDDDDEVADGDEELDGDDEDEEDEGNDFKSIVV